MGARFEGGEAAMRIHEVGGLRTACVIELALAGCGLFGGKESEKPQKPALDLGPPGKPMLSAGNGQSCGLHGSGSLYCWGRNEADTPKVAFRSVSAGFDHACAIRAEEPRQGEIA